MSFNRVSHRIRDSFALTYEEGGDAQVAARIAVSHAA